MALDIPHLMVTAAIIFAVVWGLDRMNVVGNMSRGRKTLVKFGVLFVALLILNLVWPYGSRT